jgi:hypothetical protein
MLWHSRLYLSCVLARLASLGEDCVITTKSTGSKGKQKEWGKFVSCKRQFRDNTGGDEDRVSVCSVA